MKKLKNSSLQKQTYKNYYLLAKGYTNIQYYMNQNKVVGCG